VLSLCQLIALARANITTCPSLPPGLANICYGKEQTISFLHIM
jgi:hypothetical protein